MTTRKAGRLPPNAQVVIGAPDLTESTGDLPITQISGGTSGGVMGFDADGEAISSAALAANRLLLGGGAGAAPSALGSLGTATTVLHGNASGAPSFAAVAIADLAAAVTALFASVSWGSAGAEAGNAIEITGTIQDMAGATLAVATTEVEILVSDSATSSVASVTATIAAAGTPVGTLLEGSGTATVKMRTSAGGLIAVAVSDVTTGSRYLWVKQGPNSQAYVRAQAAPKELVFA